MEVQGVTGLAQAHDLFASRLRAYIARRVGSQVAEDLLQEVFLRVARNEDALGEAHNPAAWLHTVTNSVITDHFRRKARQREDATEPGEMDRLPAEGGRAHDINRCLHPLMQTLPEKYRDVLERVDLDGEKQAQVARVAGVPAATVRARVQRARAMLRTAVREYCVVEDDAGVLTLSPGRVDCCD